MTVDQLLDELEKYLISQNPAFKSGDAYRKYLLKVSKHLSPYRVGNNLDYIAYASDPYMRLAYGLQLYSTLQEARSGHLPVAVGPKSLSNYNTPVNWLNSYLYNTQTFPLTSFASPINPVKRIPFGADTNSAHVRYCDEVTSAEKVRGLCDTLEQEYGTIIQFARDHLGITATQPYLPVFLSSEQPMDEEYLPPRSYIDKICAEQTAQLSEEERKSWLEQMRREMVFRDAVLGRFYPSSDLCPTPHIVIYFKNLYCSDHGQYIAKLANCFAHEYLHYLQYDYRLLHGALKAYCKKLDEALADFFGMLYSLNRKDIAVALGRRRQWEDRFGTTWPYSYALCFCHVNFRMLHSDKLSDYISHGCVRKLADVFSASVNQRKAFDDLLKQ